MWMAQQSPSGLIPNECTLHAWVTQVVAPVRGLLIWKIEMMYSPGVVVLAVDFSSAWVTQVEVPVRGLLITRVEVQQVFLAAAFAHFRSRPCMHAPPEATGI